MILILTDSDNENDSQNLSTAASEGLISQISRTYQPGCQQRGQTLRIRQQQGTKASDCQEGRERQDRRTTGTNQQRGADTFED